VSLFFKLHVIPPPFPLDWSTPRSLLFRTLLNHLIQDQAPIGHFFVELEASTPNAYGVKHVLTGMSRLNSNQSTLAVIREKIGLGSFFYDFAGKLDDSKKATDELAWAKKRSRLKTIQVEISDATARMMMDELEAWIINGGFKHYGGGHQIRKGEGAGCAEFGAHFFSLALGVAATPPEWIRKVYAPKLLTGGHKTGKKVSLFALFAKGSAWAKNDSDGFLYATPDMELVMPWLAKLFPGKDTVTLSKGNAEKLGNLPKASRIQFQAGYPHTSPEEIRTQWNRIKLDLA
jgi:hypothetical protein